MVIVVPPDEIIELIKKRKPKYSLDERIGFVKKEYPEIEILSGDFTLGSWQVLKNFKPDIVGVGYDQGDLKEALQKSGIRPLPEIVMIDSHKPEKYKSSIVF